MDANVRIKSTQATTSTCVACTVLAAGLEHAEVRAHPPSHAPLRPSRPTPTQQAEQDAAHATQLRQLREAEVMHARWAMLGAQ